MTTTPQQAQPDTEEPGRPGRRPGTLATTLALLALVVILVATGVVFRVIQQRHGATQNTAVADAATTSQVVGQVSAALNEVLSYNYANPAPTQQAASKLLVGDASKQYTTLFAALTAKAPGQQLTLVAKVVDAGVVTLVGNTAQLLVFLDQSSTRASDKATSASAAQIQITAVRQGGQWRISELVPL